MLVLKRSFCNSTARSGRRVGSNSGMKTPSGEEVVDVDAVPPQQFLLEQRQITLAGVAVFAQRHKGRIAGRKGGFDALEHVALSSPDTAAAC